MIGILIITHETLGAAYTQLSQHFFPTQDFNHVKILQVNQHDDHESIIAQTHKLLPEINLGNGTLILTDIFGATPCNAALKLITSDEVAMVTGLNAPMLIKAITQAKTHNNPATLAETVKQAGLNGIMAFTQENMTSH